MMLGDREKGLNADNFLVGTEGKAGEQKSTNDTGAL